MKRPLNGVLAAALLSATLLTPASAAFAQMATGPDSGGVQTAANVDDPAPDAATASAAPADSVTDAPPEAASADRAPADSSTGTADDASATPSPTATPPATATVYVVQKGDTLFSIARRHGVTVDAILWANKLNNPDVVKLGQKLTIPPATGKLHVVQDGDTLEGLAQSYGVSKAGIVAVNGLSDDATLNAGDRLLVPVAVHAPTVDPALGPAPVMAASTGASVSIQSTGTPPPLVASAAPSLVQAAASPSPSPSPSATPKPTGSPTVTVTNRKLPKLTWPVTPKKPLIGLSQGFVASVHTGVDIAAPQGTTVMAAAAGTVKLAEKNPSGFNGYGWIVILDHGDGITTWYAHLSNFNVKEGDKVEAGQKIGEVGATGRAEGTHLHFELRVNQTAIDPRLALPSGS
ncbi:MAG: peptidoglycan DD-metalloendopeptidase family protein [Chloroflexi bacterium]|nr:peptidoglycan DD-metalloendopeptidase family protein [Chloroflexota bacterium]